MAGKVKPLVMAEGELLSGVRHLGPRAKTEATPIEDSNDEWMRNALAREQADPTVASLSHPAPMATAPLVVPGKPYVADQTRQPQADLSNLPDKFTFDIEHKPDGWWVVRSPQQHVGLFIAAPTLSAALADAPGALAQILRLDGTVPAKRRKTR